MARAFRDKYPSRPLRGLPSGECLVELTSRTFQGYRLMKPTRQMNAAILGALGRASHLYPSVRLVGFWFLSNHYTMLVRTKSQRALSAFIRHLNKNISIQIRREHGWTEHAWGRRAQQMFVAASAFTQEGRLVYLLAQGTKEGLVRRPRDWGGVSSLRALLYGDKIVGTWFDRTRECNANRRWKPGCGRQRKVFPTTYEIKLAPLPCWDDLTDSERRERVCAMVKEIEERAARERKGKPPLGMKKVMEADPYERPRQVADSPAPICHGTIEEKKEYWGWYEGHVDTYRDASERLRRGDLSAWRSFPPSSFPPAIPPGVRLKLKRRRAPAAASRSSAGAAQVSLS